MQNTTGESWQRTLSNATDDEATLTWPVALFLLALGVGAVALPAVLRLPLRLPGHQGLIIMALLMAGRTGTRYRWATSVASVGAAATAALPLWGSTEPIGWLTYLLPGLLVDGALRVAPRWRASLPALALLAGVAHATKPLVRVAISALTGWQFGSLQGGLAYPLATHLVFGLIGGLLGAGVGLYAGRQRS